MLSSIVRLQQVPVDLSLAATQSLMAVLIGGAKLDDSSDGIAVLTIWTAAAREDLSPDQLREILGEGSTQDNIVQLYQKHEKELKSIVNGIASREPEIVNFEWSVSSTIESGYLGVMSGKVCECRMDVLDPGTSHARSIHFSCTLPQLQDFLWKLKEAENTMRNVRWIVAKSMDS